MLSDTDLQHIREFIAEQRESETCPQGRLWAERCALLLTELELLNRQVADLTWEAEAVTQDMRDTQVF